MKLKPKATTPALNCHCSFILSFYHLTVKVEWPPGTYQAIISRYVEDRSACFLDNISNKCIPIAHYNHDLHEEKYKRTCSCQSYSYSGNNRCLCIFMFFNSFQWKSLSQSSYRIPFLSNVLSPVHWPLGKHMNMKYCYYCIILFACKVWKMHL